MHAPESVRIKIVYIRGENQKLFLVSLLEISKKSLIM